MARARNNGLLDFFTEKKVTYRRDVTSERAQLARDQKARDQADARELKQLQIAEKKRKAERRKADDVDRKIEREWREKGHRNPDCARTLKADVSDRAKRYRANQDNCLPAVDAAAELSEAWHGRPAETETDYVERVRFHGVLTDLGRLMEVKVWVSGKHVKGIKFDKETRLASNEDGEQLYVVGGDQSLDLGSLGITGHAAKKDLTVVGPCYSVTYVTAKHHLGKEDAIPGPYEHVFSEHKQEEPELVYCTMNEGVGFAGGEYHIDIDIDGKYSAGIRD